MKNHSLEQVQNRDRIKIEEIRNFGYLPYIVKDEGTFNSKFVVKEFEKFIEMYSLTLIPCRKDNWLHESSTLSISTKMRS